ncbi:MAG: HD domain-containing protein, partial [Eisenbergiella sp.]
TQNLRLGVLRLHEKLHGLNVRPSSYGELLDELLCAQLSVFKKMYLKDRSIENIIVADDYISEIIRRRLMQREENGYVDSASLQSYQEYLSGHTDMEIAREFDMPEENVPLLRISSAIVRQVALMTGAKLVWAPGVTLCDGMAYEYAEEGGFLQQVHDFEQDIVTCARGISKRYMGSKRRAETLEQIALTIFDSMKRIHGLGKRERLLLRIATLLHDCGKYISMVNLAECSYAIIMSTEIIGLSHREREIVANVVKYNHLEFDYEMENSEGGRMDMEEYLTIAKLTAILQIANALDRSHKQKCRDIKAARRDDQLILTVNTREDITLEKGLFDRRAEFFREVYSIEPVIRLKRLP